LEREKFLERAWKQKETSGGNIVHQMRKLGVTPAWKRERFTMDSGLKKRLKKHLYLYLTKVKLLKITIW